MTYMQKQTPLTDLLDRVPIDMRVIHQAGRYESHSIPVGSLCAESAARIREMEAEIEPLRQWYADSHRIIDEWDTKCGALKARVEELEAAANSLINHWDSSPDSFTEFYPEWVRRFEQLSVSNRSEQ